MNDGGSGKDKQNDGRGGRKDRRRRSDEIAQWQRRRDEMTGSQGRPGRDEPVADRPPSPIRDGPIEDDEDTDETE